MKNVKPQTPFIDLPAFLANKVYQKLRKVNNLNVEVVRTKLIDKNDWFLPFTLK